MFENQPKGLYALALANTGERFGYYTMLAVFALFLRANYGLDAGWAGEIYSDFLMLVYFLPIVGGWLADKFGFGRMVTTGIIIMFAGYLLLSVPLGGDTVALVVMLAALVLIGLGTGLFKGNLQVMVGDLYNDPKYASQRDSGFSIFYMAINIGALFAPTAAIKIKEYAETSLGYSSNDAYHFSFAVACASLILSIAIYYVFRSTFRHTEGGKAKAAVSSTAEKQEVENPYLDTPPAETPLSENQGQYNNNNTKQKNQLLCDKSSIIPAAAKPTFNIPSVEKSAERVTDGYNAEEVEYFTEVVRENLDYWHLGDWLCQDGRDGYAEADEIVGFIVDEICSTLPYTTLRGQAFPRAVIQSKMLKANIYMVENVLENMAKVDNIKDFRRYFISSLYNEVLTYHFNEGCESRNIDEQIRRDFGYGMAV